MSPAERANVVAKLAREIGAWVNEQNGEKIVSHVALREQIYHGPYVDAAPDILVGYAPGYRASWDTTIGRIPARLIMQVHDEPVLEVQESALDAVEAGLRERMATAAALRVPLKVDVGHGCNWDEAH